MPFTFKFNKICCLSLSVGCIILGLLDLIANTYIFAMMLKIIDGTENIGPKFLLVTSALGFCTCLFMMSGSVLENRWSMLPHLAWELLLVIMYAVIGMILLGHYLQGDHSITLIKIIIILSCAPIISFFYWITIYSRYLQIKEKQLVSSNQIEME